MRVFTTFSFLFISFLFLAISLFVVLYSYNKAINNSRDMPWYPAKIYTEGQNPYVAFLEGETWFKAQAPNYPPLLYTICYPIGLMGWESAKRTWFFINSVFLFGGLFLLWKKAKISFVYLASISSLALLGYTTSNVLSNGQFTIWVFFFLTLSWVYRHMSLVMIVGLSIVLIKYSFGLPILLGFFLAGYRKEVLAAVGVHFSLVVMWAYRFDLNFLEILIAPLQVARVSTAVGPSDLLSIGRIIYETNSTSFSVFSINGITITIFLVYVAYIFICLRYKIDSIIVIVTSVLLSLFTLFHLGYDHFILLFVLPFLLQRFGFRDLRWTTTLVLASVLWLPTSIYNHLIQPILSTDTEIHFSMRMPLWYSSIIVSLGIGIVYWILITSIQKRKSPFFPLQFNNRKNPTL